MRILVISNFYPPDHKTGRALGCQDIVASLEARGHHLQVLTGTDGLRNPRSDGDIHRWLVRDSKEHPHWHDVFLKEVVNQTSLRSLCQGFQPDIIFVFDLSEISVSLALLAQEMGLSVCIYVSSDWFAVWERDSWYQLWPKRSGGFRILRFLSRHFDLLPPSQPFDRGHIIFASHHLKNMAVQVGKSVAHAPVIPWGVDTRRFSYKETNRQRPCRLLYVGKVEPQKGVNIAVEALGILKKEHGYDVLPLTISGDDQAFPYFVAHLRDLAAANGVLNNIALAGYTPRQKMPGLYQAHDIFVFPSVMEEPLSISVLEAMSCGMAVVSTSSGGNSEVLKDEINALVIPKENPRLCAQQILRLLQDPELFECIRTNARSTIEEKFRLEQSIDSIEGALKGAAGQARANRPCFISTELRLRAERARPESEAELVHRAKKWLKLGDFFVLPRAFLKPDFFFHKLKAAYQKSSSFIALLIFPILYKGFFLLSVRLRQNSPRDVSQLQNVLVVQLADMGDVILTSPFLRELRRFLPRAKIALVIQPSMFNLVEKCPYVDEVVPFHWRVVKDWKDAFRGRFLWWLKAGWLARRSLWKHHFDLAISPRWNNDPCQAASLILMYASGAPRRIAYINRPDDFMFFRLGDVNRLTTQGPVRGSPKHEVERQLDLLHFLGAHPEDTRLEVWTTPEDEQFAKNFLAQDDVSETDLLIAFAPGAAWAFRRWPVSRFIELGQWLQENYKACILIIAGKSELGLALELEKGLQRKHTANLAGKTTLREMASVLKRSKLFVGNDSGPMHVAVASGVPSVGLFGPGEYERFRPWGRDYEVIRLGLSCNPCSENCQFSEARCIKGIAVSQVKKVLSKKLESLHQLEIKKD